MAADEQWPCACKVDAALWALAAVTIKRQVIDMINSGMSREEVTVILNEQMIPEFNEWVAENHHCIMQAIHGEVPRHTVN